MNIYSLQVLLFVGYINTCRSCTGKAKHGEFFKSKVGSLKGGLGIGNKPQKDIINFDLKENRIYGLQISIEGSGPKLRVGQEWAESLKTIEGRVVCKQAPRSDYQTALYRTKVLNYASVNFKDQFSKYFVPTDRELWECSKAEDSATLLFYRVVNKFQGIAEIGKIYYYDGIEVGVVPSLRSANDRKMQTATIKEVKYLQPNPFKVLKYDGYLELLDPPDNDVNNRLNMFMAIEALKYERKTKKGTKLYKDNVGPKAVNTAKLNNAGDDLSVGVLFVKTIGSDKHIARCTRIMEDSRLFTHGFMPIIKIKKIDKYVDIPLNEFSEYFTVTQQELWSCTITEVFGYSGTSRGCNLTVCIVPVGDSTDLNIKFWSEERTTQRSETSEQFYRRVTELIGLKPVRHVDYSQSIDVWKYWLDCTKYGLKLREYYYFQVNGQTSSVVNFYGELDLIEPEVERSDKIVYSIPNNNADELPILR